MTDSEQLGLGQRDEDVTRGRLVPGFFVRSKTATRRRLQETMIWYGSDGSRAGWITWDHSGSENHALQPGCNPNRHLKIRRMQP